jgi:hypothetical protein
MIHVPTAMPGLRINGRNFFKAFGILISPQ